VGVSSSVNSAETVLGRRRGTAGERWTSNSTWKLIDERKKAKIRRDQARTTAKKEYSGQGSEKMLQTKQEGLD